MKKMNLLNHFGKWTDERPVFLIGIFNCQPQSAPHKVFAGEGNIKDADHFFDTNVNEDPREIDWILYKRKGEMLKYEEIDFNVNGANPSDHKPIFVALRIID